MVSLCYWFHFLNSLFTISDVPISFSLFLDDNLSIICSYIKLNFYCCFFLSKFSFSSIFFTFFKNYSSSNSFKIYSLSSSDVFIFLTPYPSSSLSFYSFYSFFSSFIELWENKLGLWLVPSLFSKRMFSYSTLGSYFFTGGPVCTRPKMFLYFLSSILSYTLSSSF